MEGETGITAPALPGGSVPTSGHAPVGQSEVQRLVYDGRLWGLYKIFLVNLLLSILTLGIYRFWGKTRIRRYLWSHTAYDGDRLEYTGKGSELFLGFLVVVGILIVFGLANTAVQQGLPLFVDDPQIVFGVAISLTLVFYLVLFFLIFLGQYTALRYRLTRTRWRGIRGGLVGSAWRYAWMALGFAALKLVTIGQFAPFAAVRQWSYRIGNACFGTAQASFVGSGREVYKPFLISFLAAVATMIVVYGGALALSPNVRDMLQTAASLRVEGVWGAPEKPAPDSKDQSGAPSADEGSSGDGATTDEDASGESPAKRVEHMNPPVPQAVPATSEKQAEEVFKFIGIVFLLAIPVSLVAMIAHCWYWCRLLMLMARGTSIAGLRFRATATTARLWWLLAGNVLIYLFTFGLGLPIMLQRLWRFVAANMEIIGTVDGAVIAQSRLAPPSRGEGLLEALDPGIF